MIKFRDKYPLEPIRYLGWKQPYASLMLHGKVETRTWHSPYRGWVLITASKSPYSYSKVIQISGNIDDPEKDQVLRINNTLGVHHSSLPLGKAIAIGYLHDSESMFRYEYFKSVAENQCFVNYNPHLYMHHYKYVQPIQPFDIKGAQGWRKLDEETIDKIILI